MKTFGFTVCGNVEEITRCLGISGHPAAEDWAAEWHRAAVASLESHGCEVAVEREFSAYNGGRYCKQASLYGVQGGLVSCDRMVEDTGKVTNFWRMDTANRAAAGRLRATAEAAAWATIPSLFEFATNELESFGLEPEKMAQINIVAVGDDEVLVGEEKCGSYYAVYTAIIAAARR